MIFASYENGNLRSSNVVVLGQDLSEFPPMGDFRIGLHSDMW